MRLTLEKSELLQLLSGALGYELREEEVEIQAEPFEVHLKTVRLIDLSRAKKTEAPAVQDKHVPITPKPQMAVPEEDLDTVLRQSEQLAVAGFPSADIDPDVLGMNDFSRPLRAGETEEPPGEDFSGEIPR